MAGAPFRRYYTYPPAWTDFLHRALGTDCIDVLNLFWVGVGAALTQGTLDELVRLKEEGKARSIGISIHDRRRAGQLVTDSPLDVGAQLSESLDAIARGPLDDDESRFMREFGRAVHG